MRSVLVIVGLCAILLYASNSAAEPKAARESIPASRLNKIDIIGDLGVPLGQCVEIEATVAVPEEPRAKIDACVYLLNVTSIDGVQQKSPDVVHFILHETASDVELAPDWNSLAEMKNDKVGKIPLKELEQGYVGKRVKIVAYETGRFVGMPHGKPRDVDTWQDTSFHFQSYLVVLKERK